jgi:hypothetical protein
MTSSNPQRFKDIEGIDAGSHTIINVTDPVNDQDAATKNFSKNASNLASGTVPAAVFPALSGDVSNSAGSFTITVNGLKGVSLPTLTTGYLNYSSGTGQWALSAIPSVSWNCNEIVLTQNRTIPANQCIVLVGPLTLGTYTLTLGSNARMRIL